jgi:beta-lactamase superfamily II metal-dependent hydrolase
MDLKIFDVEHGQCALLTLDDGKRIMIDVGHNSDTDWKPGEYLTGQGINALDMLVITNYDRDHVSGLNNLLDTIDVRALLRNKLVSMDQLRSIKSKTGGMSPSIERLVHSIDNVFTGPATTFTSPNFDYQVFSHSYSTFQDTNNLSLVLFVECHGIGVLFPGDLERAGWLEMLENEKFREVLKKTSVFIASHHGRDSGVCAEVFENDQCQPYYVVISDKGYEHETQETMGFYYRVAKGGPFRDNPRSVLTTRDDGRIGFTFTTAGWSTY